MDIQPKLYGTKVKSEKFLCGGWTGCDELHSFYKPQDILVLTEAMPLDDMKETHHWDQGKADRATANGTLYFGKTFCVPTLLGEFWDNCSVN